MTDTNRTSETKLVCWACHSEFAGPPGPSGKCPNCERTASDPPLDVRSSNQCGVKGCKNTRDSGAFVGPFCAPCDHDLRTGNFEFGTSVVYGQAREIERAKRIMQRAISWLQIKEAAFTTRKGPAIIEEMQRYVGDSPDETAGDIPTDGEIVDQLQDAFYKADSGYVEQNVALRRELMDVLSRYNRDRSAVEPSEIRRAQEALGDPREGVGPSHEKASEPCKHEWINAISSGKCVCKWCSRIEPK